MAVEEGKGYSATHGGATTAHPSSAVRLPQTDARETLLKSLPVVEHRIELAGVSTAVLEGGAGSPVVLLHGPGAHAAHWMEVIPVLVKDHRVVAPDLPGHGSSSAHEGPLDRSRLVTWLGALLEATCSSPPALIGHLAGGALAARFAIDRPRRLARLVLVDSFGLGELEVPADFGRALQQFFSQPTLESHEGLWAHCAFDIQALRARMGERWLSFAAYNIDSAITAAPSFSAFMEAFATHVIPTAELERIRVPTTLVCGRHDRVTLAAAQRASSRLGWPLHVVEGAADDPVVEQPESLLRLLSAALRDS
jgi:pimeloyl-ACP methyl ester carboxylesterase